MPRDRAQRRIRPGLGVAVLALGAALGGGCSEDDRSPVRVGVLMKPTLRDAIGWAASNVNAAGGVSGRRLELVFADPDAPGSAAALASDPGVVAVLGPGTSRALFESAPALLAAKKPFVSPSATAGDVFRAFGGLKYVWRTAESDVAQTQALLLVAKRDGARRVAMITPEDEYGFTFRDWFGFFAKELGLEATALERYAPPRAAGCEADVGRALEGAPDVVIAVPSDVATAVCLQRALAPRGVRVLYSDLAADPAVAAALGPAAEGMEGLTGTSDPESGFDQAYRERTGQAPPSYAAHAYDALTLLAFGLERSDASGGERLADALVDVVSGRGAGPGQGGAWTAPAVAQTLAAIRAGGRPDLRGASGALDYDPDYQTEPVSSTYGRWRVEGGAFTVVEKLPTGAGRAGGTQSIYRTLASEVFTRSPAFTGAAPGPRAGLRAFVVATSRGLPNYRHQADALAVYQGLRSRGVPDDRITLVVADDLGPEVTNEAGGPNLRAGAEVDRALGNARAEDLLALLRDAGTGEGDDVFVFLVGHGTGRGLEVQGLETGLLSPLSLADTIDAMRAQRRFRRILVAVDACQSGALAAEIARRAIPGVGVLTSSDAFEGSQATNWDPARGAWLADQFSYELGRAASATRARTLLEEYRDLYLRVSGSHVTLHNASAFADVASEPFTSFVAP